MYELKIPSPQFVQAALKAGEEANFEGAVFVLARGLSSSHQKELIDSWSEIDDVTHNDILVLTFGVSKPHSGITAYGINRQVVADEVAVGYSFAGSFEKNFEKLSKVADHVPYLKMHSEPDKVIIDSHGVTDIRRAIGVAERQLPALFIISYRHKAEYVVELGLGEAQLSPVKFMFELTKNLDDVPYRYRNLKDKAAQISQQRLQLWSQIGEKQKYIKEHRNTLDQLESKGQLESVIYHIEQTLVDAPDSLKDMGEKIIEFLSGKDEKLEIIKDYESNLIRYALSPIKKPAIANRLPKKLNKAIRCRIRNEPFQIVIGPQLSPKDHIDRRKQLELEISKLTAQILQIEKQTEVLRIEEKTLSSKGATLHIQSAFKSAIETTLKQFELRPKSLNDDESLQRSQVFNNFLRVTYILRENTEMAQIENPQKSSSNRISIKGNVSGSTIIIGNENTIQNSQKKNSS